MLGASGGPIIIALGGLIGQSLAPSPLLFTLPVFAYTLAMAIGTLPAAALMRRWGRRQAYLLGAPLGVTGGAVASAALFLGSFWSVLLRNLRGRSLCLLCTELSLCGHRWRSETKPSAGNILDHGRWATGCRNRTPASHFRPRSSAWGSLRWCVHQPNWASDARHAGIDPA